MPGDGPRTGATGLRAGFLVGVAWNSVLERRDPAGRSLFPTGNGKDVYSVTLGVNVPLFRAPPAMWSTGAGARDEAARYAALRRNPHLRVRRPDRTVRPLGSRPPNLEGAGSDTSIVW